MELPETKTLPLTEIKPYYRNPRRIPAEAVAAVADSIKEYGYVQPIVVDEDNVIVVGHTRHKALTKLGVTEAQVYVTNLPENKVREYRLADNRTGELTDWDHGALVLELREFEEGLVDRYFPDFDLEIEQVEGATDVTKDEVEQATKDVLKVSNAPELSTVEVGCPACEGTFKVRSDSLPGLSKGEVQEMKSGGTAK